MLLTRLIVLLFLTGHVFAKEPPDVECLVVHLKYVNCNWNKPRIPNVNYTFASWFHHDKKASDCTTYVSENSTVTGCSQPYDNLISQRFLTFYTLLTHGNETFERDHNLKQRVQLYPPSHLTVKNGSDFNLWFYWNQTALNCVESEVRFRTNNKKWDTSLVSNGRQSYCINLPSSSAQYELQVRSMLGSNCGESLFWSNWSEPAVWGANNSIDANRINVSASVWTPFLYVVGGVTLILLVIMLLYHERLRIIPIHPKPSLVLSDIEDWLQFSKGLKGNFKDNYNEHACPVREYCHVSQTDSESSDGSTFSVTTDQTDFSVSMPVSKSEDLSTSFSSSTSAVSTQEEQQIAV
ncbi:putative cytokine receptor common subunit gamma-like [Scophthalmus maximus]|uniref:Putative cytokine receptor common subunit gamma-like n=1 Tax=Scophthalmus maximus TaxID=52904 RepID=A0A2U9B7P8_SCOMX|nr:cytokine receptor common subunit gamma [Scophthalmus maximus]AWO99879.1 putative cytokine receptor common subunit gamma-like [Scophthalmus maximus]